TEQGYNTDGTVEPNTKGGSFTHAIKVSDMPGVTNVAGHAGQPYWELFSDINESTGTISLNDVEVWLTTDPNITGYNGSGFDTYTGSAPVKVYDFEGQVLINDVNAGSGRADLRYRIPLTTAIQN